MNVLISVTISFSSLSQSFSSYRSAAIRNTLDSVIRRHVCGISRRERRASPDTTPTTTAEKAAVTHRLFSVKVEYVRREREREREQLLLRKADNYRVSIMAGYRCDSLRPRHHYRNWINALIDRSRSASPTSASEMR